MTMRQYGRMNATPESTLGWAKHDHSQVWGSNGAVQKILENAAVELERLVADETKAAVADYAANSQIVLGVSPEGHLLVGARLYNEKAEIIAKVPFLKLVQQAIENMRGSLATDDGAQALLSSIVNTGKILYSVGTPGSKAPPAPARTHQQHAVRSVPQRPVRQPQENTQ